MHWGGLLTLLDCERAQVSVWHKGRGFVAAVQVSVLTWEGLTSSVAKWQSHRYVHVWRGRLYITAHKEDTETVLTKTYWMAYRVVQLQPSVRAWRCQLCTSLLSDRMCVCVCMPANLCLTMLNEAWVGCYGVPWRAVRC